MADDHSHVEEHFLESERIRDVVIGMADGLTVPFALAAGISGAVATNQLVITAGLAEIAAGSIAMGLGGYLAARTDREHYFNELARERDEIKRLPDRERQEVADIVRTFGVNDEQVEAIVTSISSNDERWVDFMMQYELGLSEPDPKRARNSSLTIGISYIIGGLIPLGPYLLLASPMRALWLSVILTLVALLVFGFVKGKMTGSKPMKSALQTAVVGGVAAAVAFFVARWIA